ncbi:MAG: putative membrane protein [Saprospiraceae bacterium]
MGYRSAQGDTAMNKSTYIGYQSGFYSLSESISRIGNVFVGYKSGKGENHSNRLYIENADADATKVLIYGRFDTDVLSFNANVGINTIEPSAMLEVFGTSIGSLANVLLSDSEINGFARLRFENLSIDSNYWDIAGRPKLDGADSIAVLNFFYNKSRKNVLQLFGDGDATLKGNLTESSDRRLKRNIVELNEVLLF